MGLDSYLTRTHRFYNRDDVTDRIQDAIAQEFGASADFGLGMGALVVQVPVMYLRKDWPVHQWFVKNVQDGKDDCETYLVDADDLRHLHDDLEQALKYPDLGVKLFGAPWADSCEPWRLDMRAEVVENLKRELRYLKVYNQGGTHNVPYYEYHGSW